jgi:hypothetical protein
MFRNISKYDDYKARTMTMNFEIEDLITLHTNDGDFKPVLANLENVYGLSNSRNIYVVFADQVSSGLDKATELDFIFDDELFDSGRNHFGFEKKNFDNIPHLVF